MPTLIISAPDNLFEPLPGAQFTAAHIPGAELKVLDSGGHLLLGQGEQVRMCIEDFLDRRLKAGDSHASARTRARNERARAVA